MLAPAVKLTSRLEGIPATALPSSVSVIDRVLLSGGLFGVLENARIIVSMTFVHAWVKEDMWPFPETRRTGTCKRYKVSFEVPKDPKTHRMIHVFDNDHRSRRWSGVPLRRTT